MMKLLICDLEMNEFNMIFPNISDDIKVILKKEPIGHCIGCFGCWIKTPAVCVIKDNYSNMGEYLSKSDEVIIISKCTYGGFSPFVKNIMDRSIPYIHPYFKNINGEMHHKRRYKNDLNMTVYFYGKDITDKEKETADKLIKANSINLYCKNHRVSFVESISQLGGII